MLTELNDLEGLRIAIDIEDRGYNFYRVAYEKYTDPKMKELFRMLMDEEKEHLRTFTKYFEDIEKTKEAHSSDYLFDPDVSGYLTILASSHVFPPKEKTTTFFDQLKTPLEVLLLAMRAEKDSILLYGELANCSKIPSAQKIFQKLKLEEQHHTLEIGTKVQAIMQE